MKHALARVNTFELIGVKIKILRKQKGLTQTQLGELVGVQKAQISKIEKSTANVKISTVYKVLSALGAKLTWEINANTLDDSTLSNTNKKVESKK